MTHSNPRLLGSCLLLAAVMPSALALQTPPATGCKPVSLPAETKATLVADRIAVNGLPMNIIEARHAMAPAAFVKHFQDLWTVLDQGIPKKLYVEYDLATWQVIAHREGPCFYTVQVHPKERTTTSLIGMGLPDQIAPPTATPQVSLPAGTQLLSHMVSDDRGKTGEHWVASSDRSVLEAARFFSDNMKAAGWQALSVRLPRTSAETATLMYQKGTQHLGIAITPSTSGAGGSMLVLTSEALK